MRYRVVFGQTKCPPTEFLTDPNCCQHRIINYIDTKAKCRYLKKLTCKGTLRQVFICLRPPSHLGFFLGWYSNFVGSESGQIQSGKLLQNMVSNRTQTTPPPRHTLSVYTVLCHRRVGSSSQSWVENINMTDCISSQETRINTSRKALYRSIFSDDDNLLWCLYGKLVNGC